MQLSTTPLEVTYLRTTSLKPDPRNPMVHSDKQVRQIAQSGERRSCPRSVSWLGSCCYRRRTSWAAVLWIRA
jgi:hypothetical protein